MKQTLNYNLHNILNFRIVREGPRRLRDWLNLRYRRFETTAAAAPDITLNIGPFRPDNGGCYLIDHKYHVRDNYLYCRDGGGGARWAAEIQGLDTGPTTINFSGKNGPGLYRWLNPDLLPQLLLLRLIEHRLALKGYHLLHAAGVAREGQGYLLSGRSGAYKTTLCLDLVRRGGFGILGDDRVIVSDSGEMYDFMADTSSPPLFQYMLENLPTEDDWTILKQAGYWWRQRRPRPPDHRPVAEKARLKAAFFLARGHNAEDVSCRPLNRSELAARLAANGRLEDFTRPRVLNITGAPFYRYLLAYAFVFPDSALARGLADGSKAAAAFPEIPAYQVSIPPRYTPDIYERVYNVITTAGEGPTK